MQKKGSSRLLRIEEDLAEARAAIRGAIRRRNFTSEKEDIFVPKGCVYRNAYAFHRLSNYIYTIYLLLYFFIIIKIN